MLFGDIDWNRVLIKGLIGGVIGGLVGLIAYFVKKPPDKKNGDDADKGRPR